MNYFLTVVVMRSIIYMSNSNNILDMKSLLLAFGLGILVFIVMVFVDSFAHKIKFAGKFLYILAGILTGYMYKLTGSSWSYLFILLLAFCVSQFGQTKNTARPDGKWNAILFGVFALIAFMLFAAQSCVGSVCHPLIG